MNFIIPTRFNLIRDVSQASTGTNILVPAHGATKATEQYLNNTADSATKERMIVDVLQRLRASPSSKNNFEPSASNRIAMHEKGMSHYVYSRLTPMYFHSAVLNETFLYSDYIVYLNACYIALLCDNTNHHWSQLVDDFYQWSRLRELHIVWKRHLEIYRCDTLWKTVDERLTYDIIVEASNIHNAGTRLQMFDRRKIRR